MKYLGILIVLVVAIGAGINDANACYAEGRVYCDNNQNGTVDAGDTSLAGVVVNIANEAGTWSGSTVTDAEGYFYLHLPDGVDVYVESLDETTLPPDSTFVHPAGGSYSFEVSQSVYHFYNEWLVDSPTCRAGKCWLTGGGVKFEPVLDDFVAERGPKHSIGGNVFPSCDPDPGDGGQWNHVAHGLKLHFQGTTIHTVECGNVPGIDPGSESPVTPYNYIEFQGYGRLKGIKGNKVDYGTVYFFARAEDHNEPGSNGAKDGADIDRYFLHVFSDPANPMGTTLLLVDEDGDATTLDPVTITGGNLQLHISSCDDPPR